MITLLRRVLAVLLLCTLMVSIPINAQSDCPMTPRLTVGAPAKVSFTDGAPLNIRADASRNAEQVGQIPEGTSFEVIEGPVCADGIQWWNITAGDLSGWIAEGVDGVYLVEPDSAQPQATTAPLAFDWETFSASSYMNAPDPTQITLPNVYGGDLPALPITATDIRYLEDANLSEEQMALLMQNGFVVVPAGDQRFREGYSYQGGWKIIEGGDMEERPLFVTTDVMLNSLHMIFEQLLTELENSKFYLNIYQSIDSSLRAANQQYQEAIGTPLEKPARNALIYLAVARLLMPEEPSNLQRGAAGFIHVGSQTNPLEELPDDVREEAQAIVDLIVAAEGQHDLSFFKRYTEDFGAYTVRGHYTNSTDLTNYFRVMSWLGRINFSANDAEETTSALLIMRVFALNPAALDALHGIDEAITMLVGPADDLTLFDYLPLAQTTFGDDLALSALADSARFADFQAQIKTLPKPRINSLVLAADTEAEDLPELGQGFRLMGQRFTYDGYVLGQLFAPNIEERWMPTALDVPAAFGSDVALGIIEESGMANYDQYPGQLAKMREEMAAVPDSEWLDSTAGGWLWMLEPLWLRDNPQAYPPLMLTDAWRRRELQTGLASYTELKHGTVLYAKEPSGLGGGGSPLLAYGYLEPNPLLFARISILSATTYQRLVAVGLLNLEDYNESNMPLLSIGFELRDLAMKSASYAEAARRELAGEPLDEDTYFSIQEFDGYLQSLEYHLYSTLMNNNEPLPPSAVVTTIANNATTQQVLHVGTGLVDYIYIVIPGPDGLQLARGGVYSYYEFPTLEGVRLTDEEWRERLLAGEAPPRPAWVEAFYKP